MPLRRGEEALQVNRCETPISREDNGQRPDKNGLITHHQLSAGNGVPIVRDGRARRKSENETNNVLKTKGTHLCSIACWNCWTNSTACCAGI